MDDDEDIVYDDDMRAAEAAALSSLMSDSEFMARCERKLGVESLQTMRTQHEAILASEDKQVGKIIEEVVNTYGAPHLRAVAILDRAGEEATADPACYSLKTLLNYSKA